MLAFMRCCDRRGIKVKIVLVDWRKLLLDVEKRGDIFFWIRANVGDRWRCWNHFLMFPVCRKIWLDSSDNRFGRSFGGERGLAATLLMLGIGGHRGGLWW